MLPLSDLNDLLSTGLYHNAYAPQDEISIRGPYHEGEVQVS